jgi:hypothetical protein
MGSNSVLSYLLLGLPRIVTLLKHIISSATGLPRLRSFHEMENWLSEVVYTVHSWGVNPDMTADSLLIKHDGNQTIHNKW